MATNITPLGTRVLVKRIELDEQKSDGGIFLPDTAKASLAGFAKPAGLV